MIARVFCVMAFSMASMFRSNVGGEEGTIIGKKRERELKYRKWKKEDKKEEVEERDREKCEKNADRVL